MVIFIALLWQAKPVTAPAINNNLSNQINSITIDFIFDKETPVSLQYPYSIINENLLAATTKIAQKQNWLIDSEDYGELGVLITQIKDLKNGQNQKYWQYSINGQMPMVSVDKYFLQPNDHIEWKFDKSEF